MKDDLISRKAAIEAVKIPDGGCVNSSERHGIIFARVEARRAIQSIPSVPAVPLEPLCNFLAAYAAPPIRSPLALYGSLEEAWKAFLIDWMEEQDEAD